MRNGILLAEDSPENILTAFNTSSLEDAFLILSQKQGQSEEADSTVQRVIEGYEKDKEDDDMDAKPPMRNEKYGMERLRRNMSFAEQKPPGFWGKMQFTSSIRMKALLTKNILQLVRQPS